MRCWPVLLVAGLSFPCAIAQAETTGTVPVPIARQLSGLGAGEADALIAKLETAQRCLRAGEFQWFELLAGSVASYEETTISPRDAFLKTPFREVWDIERVRTDNRWWQPYKLAYAPDGIGKRYWEIEVVVNAAGEIERVPMLSRSPAPF